MSDGQTREKESAGSWDLRKRGIAPLHVSDFWKVWSIGPIRLFAYEAGPIKLLVLCQITGRLPDNSLIFPFLRLTRLTNKPALSFSLGQTLIHHQPILAQYSTRTHNRRVKLFFVIFVHDKSNMEQSSPWRMFSMHSKVPDFHQWRWCLLHTWPAIFQNTSFPDGASWLVSGEHITEAWRGWWEVRR